MAFSPHSLDQTSAVIADMIREAFPGLSTAQRCQQAARLLDLHPRNVRRLEAGETRGTADHFLALMRRLGVDKTLQILERHNGR